MNVGSSAISFWAVLEAAPDAILIIERDGRIVFVNAQVEALFGYSRDQLLGQTVEVLVPVRFREVHPAHRSGYFNEQRVRPMGTHLDLCGLRRDGSEFPAEIMLSPLASEDGTLVTAVIRDVTERKRVERRFRGLLEAAPDAIVIVDEGGVIVLVNAQTEKMFGYSRDDLVGQRVEVLVPVRYREAHAARRAAYQAEPRVRAMGSGFQLFGVRKSGDEFPVEISLSPLDTDEGLLVSAAIRDVTERARAEEVRARLAAMVDTSDDAMYFETLDSIVRSWNPAARDLLGYASGEVIGKSASILTPEYLLHEIRDLLQVVMAGDRVSHHETVCVHKDGSRVEVSMSLSPILDRTGTVIGISTVARDIRPTKEAARALKALNEKEVLLKEVHHRVKNNLQVISSMLNLQASYITDETALAMFRDSQVRVRSIALFHERLSQSPDLASIDLGEYLRGLTMSILATHGTHQGTVQVDVDVDVESPSAGIDIDVAIPLGLILNELVSNALKHAFPEGRGRIRVAFTRRARGVAELVVQDDGIGLPPHVDFGNPSSLGLQIVSTLVEQLRGTLDVARGGGACFTLSFECLPQRSSTSQRVFAGSRA